MSQRIAAHQVPHVYAPQDAVRDLRPQLNGKQIERGQIRRRRAIVVRITDRKNLAGQNARFSDWPGVRATGFRLENRQDDGVAFDEYFFCRIAIQ